MLFNSAVRVLFNIWIKVSPSMYRKWRLSSTLYIVENIGRQTDHLMHLILSNNSLEKLKNLPEMRNRSHWRINPCFVEPLGYRATWFMGLQLDGPADFHRLTNHGLWILSRVIVRHIEIVRWFILIFSAIILNAVGVYRFQTVVCVACFKAYGSGSLTMKIISYRERIMLCERWMAY